MSKNIDRYTYRVTWSEEDGEYVGLCAEFESLSWLSTSPEKALSGIRKLVKDVIADMKKNNEEIPEALSTKSYSGKFMVRVPPETHRSLAIKAAESGVSLNRLVSSKLSQMHVTSKRIQDGFAARFLKRYVSQSSVITRILDQSLAEGFLRSFETYEITHAWQGTGTSIFLELGTLTQDKRHNSNGEMGFSFEWSWRIENRHSILLGTFSEDEDISKAISILKGKKIIKAELFGRLKEILLQLDGDIWFSSFATSEGDPEWGARNRSNEWLYFRKGNFLVESDT